MSDVYFQIRPACVRDGPRLQIIREAAFAPVFASFRSILGDVIYEAAQARDDEAQGELLAFMLKDDSGWNVYVAEIQDTVVGFVSVQLKSETGVGELGLNAVHPSFAGKGIGRKLYDFALVQMRDAGMKVAMVATGADPSHAPARKAYRKSGFSIEIGAVWMYRQL